MGRLRRPSALYADGDFSFGCDDKNWVESELSASAKIRLLAGRC
jgi:hypothetical protein